MEYFKFLIINAIDDFKRNKVRTILTSLGILIGVFAVVILIALGLGLKNYIRGQFESLGTNVIYILPGQMLRNGQFRDSEGVTSFRFDEKDINSLKKIPGVELVVPVQTQPVTLEYGTKSELSDLYQTTEGIFEMRNLTAQEGTLFSRSDVDKKVKQVVLGPKIAEKLFDSPRDAVNKYIRINNQRYQIIGVLEAKGGGGLGGPDFDSYTYIPYKSATSFNPKREFFTINVTSSNEDNVSEVKESVKQELLKRYDDTDFSVAEQTEILNIVNSIFSIINSVLIAIGSISLIVGGIGIMNIMYATVTERTKEIGIRRAIGATKQDILFQFLTESTLLSLLGGLLGLALAYVVVTLIKPFFPAAISITSVIIAVTISSIIGIFFGVFPARKAAKLSPIEAIRYE